MPTPALIHSFGTLYASLRIEKSQLCYLRKILGRNDQHWTKIALKELERQNLGWCKSIKETLRKNDLPIEFPNILNYSPREWKKQITKCIEIQHYERLQEDCYTQEGEQKRPKTKTASIVEQLNGENYVRAPMAELLHCNKHETKTLMIARYRMLECGKNFRGSINGTCNICNEIDDEMP